MIVEHLLDILHQKIKKNFIVDDYEVYEIELDEMKLCYEQLEKEEWNDKNVLINKEEQE